MAVGTLVLKAFSHVPMSLESLPQVKNSGVWFCFKRDSQPKNFDCSKTFFVKKARMNLKLIVIATCFVVAAVVAEDIPREYLCKIKKYFFDPRELTFLLTQTDLKQLKTRVGMYFFSLNGFLFRLFFSKFLTFLSKPTTTEVDAIDAEKRQQSCMNQCSGHGLCVGSRCACNQGWVGDDCSIGKLMGVVHDISSFLLFDVKRKKKHLKCNKKHNSNGYNSA